MAAPLFTTGRVRELRPFITRVIDDIMAEWRPGTRVDLVAELAVPLPVTVICELLGVPESDRAALAGWSHELFDATDTARVDAASHRIGDYLTHLVDTARATPGDGPLHSLLRAAATRAVSTGTRPSPWPPSFWSPGTRPPPSSSATPSWPCSGTPRRSTGCAGTRT